MLGKLRQFLEVEIPATSSQERRAAPRAPARSDCSVRIDSKFYALSNWGPSGFMLDSFDGSMVLKQRFSAVIVMKEGDNTKEFRTDAVVVRAEGKVLGAKFLFLSPEARRAIELRIRKAD